MRGRIDDDLRALILGKLLPLLDAKDVIPVEWLD